MMKKVFVVALACVMAAFAILPVFASSNDTTVVTYTVAEGYTFEAGAEVTITGYGTAGKGTCEIQFYDVLIPNGKVLKATITSANNFKLMLSDSYINYQMKLGQTAFGNGDVILTCAAGNSSAFEEFDFVATQTAGSVKYAGAHTDTITYTISQVDAN